MRLLQKLSIREHALFTILLCLISIGPRFAVQGALPIAIDGALSIVGVVAGLALGLLAEREGGFF